MTLDPSQDHDFDLAGLARRLSISSFMSSSSESSTTLPNSEEGAGESDDSSRSFTLPDYYSTSSQTDQSIHDSAPTLPAGLSTPKGSNSRYGSKSKPYSDYDEGQTPTLASSSRNKKKPHMSKSVSDPLQLMRLSHNKEPSEEWIDSGLDGMSLDLSLDSCDI